MAHSSLRDIAPFSPATLVIDLENLRHNLTYFRGLLDDRTRIMAMVKADAYGCGAVEISKALGKWGVQDLGVAYTHEGINLRKQGVDASIMVMNPLPQDFLNLVNYNLEPELFCLSLLREWVDFIRREKLEDYPVHLEVDTGMKRLGFVDDEMGAVSDILRLAKTMKVKSIFSHLASSSNPEDDAFTNEQFDRFNTWYGMVQTTIGSSPMRHMLNSGGIYRFPGHHYDMVRLGVGLYGVGMESLPVQQELKPVQSLYASISQIKNIAVSETVGYGRSGSLPSSGRIAIINIGYADGLCRLGGHGRFSVRIEEELCPVVGSVCMDMTMVDVSSCVGAKAGVPVEIYGEHHSIIHLAQAAETIPYEILTANHQRLYRLIRHV